MSLPHDGARPGRRRLLAAAGAALALPFVGSARAQGGGWPGRPVSFVVPFPAGGGTDAFARPLTAVLTRSLGRQVIIDNRGGAGGTVGAGIAAKSAPDGYTFFMGAVHHTIAPSMYPKLDYSLENDFVPVGLISSVPQVVVVNPQRVAATDLKSFLDYARKNPGKLNYASAGNGTSHHLAGELFKLQTQTFITHIPYRGAGPALQDLIAGRIDFMCEVISTGLPPIQSKLVKPIALLSTRRASVLPQLPTALEQGLPDVDADGWNAFFFPKGTPDPIVRRLNAATSKALDNPALSVRMEELGLTVPPADRRTPEHLGELVRMEIGKWAPPIKASGFSAD